MAKLVEDFIIHNRDRKVTMTIIGLSAAAVGITLFALHLHFTSNKKVIKNKGNGNNNSIN